MYPEVQQIGQGNCPKCGMALELMLPNADADADDGGELASMTRRFWILVVLWGGGPFFERGGKSLRPWHPNMYTLIALVTGVAWLSRANAREGW